MTPVPSVLTCPAKAVEGKSLLLVILTDLDQTGQADLVQHVGESLPDDTKIQLWHPPKTTLWYVTHRSLHQDSTANIYAVAILAYRSGWTNLLVADNLTIRQLTKNQNMGESSSISMTMVAVRKSQFSRKDQVRVVARRTAGRDKADLHHTLHTFDIAPHFLGEWHHRVSRIYEDEGFELYDPDSCILAPDTTSFFAEELANITHAALSKSLPPVLVHYIFSFIPEEDPPQPISKPSWADHDPYYVQIFTTFYCGPEQLLQMQFAIDEAIQAYSRKEGSRNITIRLIRSSNESNRTPTRRDLIHTWDRYHTPMGPDTIFLPEPISDSQDLESTRLIVLHTSRHSPLVAVPITLRTIIQGQPPVLEFMHHPSQPFYTNPQFWHPSEESPLRVPLFYLTDKLNPEQDASLQAEIYTHWKREVDDEHFDDSENLECMVIPWGRHETDGTLDDMWSIFWKVGLEFFVPVIFFVDNQSGRDHSVVIAQADFVDDFQLTDETQDVLQKLGILERPDLCGFRYCRIPGRQSHSVQWYLEMEAGDIEDLVMEGSVQRFSRPGWPHHLIER
ncbi:hypothetical protein N7532_009509 [Penicillium argentinense]|uniref:Uncharacterized protein n=1 Tax=Penicillium argentinense TaxID=1131581 RepID=A0A9W9K2X8_9EURO|nr:uncharacterized protein N7532_009509 [Penicillium argentinense]KAJ5090825.1 hypothetical protein N7532_009509 [Penicillium argentinense]